MSDLHYACYSEILYSWCVQELLNCCWSRDEVGGARCSHQISLYFCGAKSQQMVSHDRGVYISSRSTPLTQLFKPFFTFIHQSGIFQVRVRHLTVTTDQKYREQRVIAVSLQTWWIQVWLSAKFVSTCGYSLCPVKYYQSWASSVWCESCFWPMTSQEKNSLCFIWVLSL